MPKERNLHERSAARPCCVTDVFRFRRLALAARRGGPTIRLARARTVRFWLVDALRPRTIVELGVHNGFSYFAMCQAVRRLHLDTRCFAIDSWGGDEHAGYYGEEVYQQACGYNCRLWRTFRSLIRSDFADACEHVSPTARSTCCISTASTPMRRCGMISRAWLPKLSGRGIVLFHDTAEYGTAFGVHRLWDELRARYPHFEFEHGHGLGRARRRPQSFPPSLRRFFARLRQTRAQNRRPFATDLRTARRLLMEDLRLEVVARDRVTGILERCRSRSSKRPCNVLRGD